MVKLEFGWSNTSQAECKGGTRSQKLGTGPVRQVVPLGRGQVGWDAPSSVVYEGRVLPGKEVICSSQAPCAHSSTLRAWSDLLGKWVPRRNKSLDTSTSQSYRGKKKKKIVHMEEKRIPARNRLLTAERSPFHATCLKR